MSKGFGSAVPRVPYHAGEQRYVTGKSALPDEHVAILLAWLTIDPCNEPERDMGLDDRPIAACGGAHPCRSSGRRSV